MGEHLGGGYLVGGVEELTERECVKMKTRKTVDDESRSPRK